MRALGHSAPGRNERQSGIKQKGFLRSEAEALLKSGAGGGWVRCGSKPPGRLIVPEASLVVAATQSSGMVCSAFDKIPLGAEPKLLVPSPRTAILFPTFVSAHADLIFGDVFPTAGIF